MILERSSPPHRGMRVIATLPDHRHTGRRGWVAASNHWFVMVRFDGDCHDSTLNWHCVEHDPETPEGTPPALGRRGYK